MNNSIICTVTTKNHIANVRTLAKTFIKYNPEGQVYVLLADKIDGYFEPSKEPFILIRLEDLPDQNDIKKLLFYYTPFELCNALRGNLHEYIYNKTDANRWLYIDADIMVCHSFKEIFEQLNDKSILLSPHRIKPSDIKQTNPVETLLLRIGLYNSGFLGLKRSEETGKFIRWYKSRLIKFCFIDYIKGVFVDQLWLNFVPLYFRGVSFLTNPGANVGHWKLFESRLTKKPDGTIMVDDQPLLFMHFSGWDISSPNKVSKHAVMDGKNLSSIWNELSESYRKELLDNEYESVSRYPYAFDHFKSGEVITTSMRRVYYDDLIRGKELQGSPFDQYAYFKERLSSNKQHKIVSFLRSAGKNTLNHLNKMLR